MFDESRSPAHALMQNPAFARALRICGQHPRHLPGGLMVLHRRFAGVPVAMLPRAAPPKDLPDQLRAIGLHRTPLFLSPDRPVPLSRTRQLRSPRVAIIWEIPFDEDACRKALHPKWRNQLRRAEALGLTVSRSNLQPDPNGPLLRQAADDAKAGGFAQWPAALTAAFAACAPHQTHVFRAHLGGNDIAHMVFLSHGNAATYHIGQTSIVGRANSAHNLLLWHAARHFAQLEISELDLGLADAKTPGLDRFKLRTGARQRATGGTHLYWHPFRQSRNP